MSARTEVGKVLRQQREVQAEVARTCATTSAHREQWRQNSFLRFETVDEGTARSTAAARVITGRSLLPLSLPVHLSLPCAHLCLISPSLSLSLVSVLLEAGDMAARGGRGAGSPPFIGSYTPVWMTWRPVRIVARVGLQTGWT